MKLGSLTKITFRLAATADLAAKIFDLKLNGRLVPIPRMGKLLAPLSGI